MKTTVGIFCVAPGRFISSLPDLQSVEIFAGAVICFYSQMNLVICSLAYKDIKCAVDKCNVDEGWWGIVYETWLIERKAWWMCQCTKIFREGPKGLLSTDCFIDLFSNRRIMARCHSHKLTHPPTLYLLTFSVVIEWMHVYKWARY